MSFGVEKIVEQVNQDLGIQYTESTYPSTSKINIMYHAKGPDPLVSVPSRDLINQEIKQQPTQQPLQPLLPFNPLPIIPLPPYPASKGQAALPQAALAEAKTEDEEDPDYPEVPRTFDQKAKKHNWCFTDNLYHTDPEGRLKFWIEKIAHFILQERPCLEVPKQYRTREEIAKGLPNKALEPILVRYLVFSIEIAPTTGRRHLQGFFSTDQPRSWHDIVARIQGVDIRPMYIKSKPSYCREYCLKGNFVTKADYKRLRTCAPRYGEGVNLYSCVPNQKEYALVLPEHNAFEYGHCPRQGMSGQVNQISTEIKNGSITNLKQIHELAPQVFYQYTRACEKALRLYEKPRQINGMKVVIYWGDAGTGKSSIALQNGACKLAFSGGTDNIFINGYKGETSILIDDIDKTQGFRLPCDYLMDLLDIHPFVCNIKGGDMLAQWDTVYITANSPPEKWYPHLNSEPKWKAFMRRFRIIYEVERDDTQPLNLPQTQKIKIQRTADGQFVQNAVSPIVQLTLADIERYQRDCLAYVQNVANQRALKQAVANKQAWEIASQQQS